MMLFLHGMFSWFQLGSVAELPLCPKLSVDNFIMWGGPGMMSEKWGKMKLQATLGTAWGQPGSWQQQQPEAPEEKSTVLCIKEGGARRTVTGLSEAKPPLFPVAPPPPRALLQRAPRSRMGRGEHGEVSIQSQEIRDPLNPVWHTGKTKTILQDNNAPIS